MLKINNLYCFKENKIILNDISFSITRNESLSMIFENDETKYSFLRILLGTDKQDIGSIELNDKVLNNIKPSKRNIGYISKNPCLREDLTVYDNIAYELRKKGVNEEIVEEKVDALIKDFDLDIISSIIVKDISLYQKLIVSLLRFISSNKELLIFEDILNIIDENKKEEYITFIKRIHNYLNKPVMIYLDKVNNLTNKTIIISKEGKIIDFERNNTIFRYPKNKKTCELLNIEYIDNINKDKYYIDANIIENIVYYEDKKVVLNNIFNKRFINKNIKYIEIENNKLSTVDTGNDLRFTIKDIKEDGDLLIIDTGLFKIIRTNNIKYHIGMNLYYPIEQTYFLDKNKEKVNSVYDVQNNSIKFKSIIKTLGMIKVYNHILSLNTKIGKFNKYFSIKSDVISNINNKHGIRIKEIVSCEKLANNLVLGLKFYKDDNIYFVINNQIDNIYTNKRKYLLINIDNIKLL